MDKCTHDVRSARWKQVILNCPQRPADKSIKQWLEENDILEQSYYYCNVNFVELSAPVHQEVPIEYNPETIKPVAVIKTATMSLVISNDISDHLLLYKRFEDGRLSWPRTT